MESMLDMCEFVQWWVKERNLSFDYAWVVVRNSGLYYAYKEAWIREYSQPLKKPAVTPPPTSCNNSLSQYQYQREGF